MKKPDNYEFKKWLTDNIISGVRLHYYQTGTDTSDTDWEFIPFEGKSRRVNADIAKSLVEFNPDWVRLCQVKDSIVREVEAWAKYAAKEKRDLAELKRLQTKFGIV